MSTKISWTQETWNPTTGCDRVSAGCDNCYALTLAKRLKAMGQARYQNDGDPRTSGPGFGLTMHPDSLDAPLHWRKPRRVFVNSMSDLFHPRVTDEFIGQVWDTMGATPQHTYQILTKRAPRMASMLTRWRDEHETPLPNVHIGVSVEDQQRAEERVPRLTSTPGAIRFLSCEPLLAPVDLGAWMPAAFCRWHCVGCRRFYAGPHQKTCPGCGRDGYWCGSHVGNSHSNGQPINWVIIGGESGPGARPMHLDWASSLVEQCRTARVPVFVKQLGTAAGGARHHDINYFPPDLQVREYPSVLSGQPAVTG